MKNVNKNWITSAALMAILTACGPAPAPTDPPVIVVPPEPVTKPAPEAPLQVYASQRKNGRAGGGLCSLGPQLKPTGPGLGDRKCGRGSSGRQGLMSGQHDRRLRGVL